jgi:periplasmic protein TonB
MRPICERVMIAAVIFLCCVAPAFSQEAESTDTTKVFLPVEQQPEFVGGYPALMEFINKERKYPKSARREGVEGEVRVSFVIDKTGNITDVKTIKSLHPDCDAEAERVVKAMPPWKPGMQNGKPVFVRFSIPIKFRR